jgi:hypothetical protein
MMKEGMSQSIVVLHTPARTWSSDDDVCMLYHFFGCAHILGFAIANNVFIEELQRMKKLRTTIQFFDSNTGNLLFQAPVGRSYEELEMNCKINGWLCFTDDG